MVRAGWLGVQDHFESYRICQWGRSETGLRQDRVRTWFCLDWPVSLPRVRRAKRRASNLTQIGYSLAGQARFRHHGLAGLINTRHAVILSWTSNFRIIPLIHWYINCICLKLNWSTTFWAILDKKLCIFMTWSEFLLRFVS